MTTFDVRLVLDWTKPTIAFSVQAFLKNPREEKGWYFDG